MMNRTPPIIPMTFSDRYFATTAPPETAIPVATAWAAIAPAATLTGFCAADNAMVDKKDLSPNSAANTNPNILNKRALLSNHNMFKVLRKMLWVSKIDDVIPRRNKIKVMNNRSKIMLNEVKWQ